MPGAADTTWLAAFAAEPDPGPASIFDSFIQAHRPPDRSPVGIVVEVTLKKRGEWIVVFAGQRPSTAIDPARLEAIVAFSDSSLRCDRFSLHGLPAFEAQIDHDPQGGVLTVTIHAFEAESGSGAPPGRCTQAQFRIKGLPIGTAATGGGTQRTTGGKVSQVRHELVFRQRLASPSPVDPGETVQVRDSDIHMAGDFVSVAGARVTLEIPALRYPPLSPLDRVSAGTPAYHLWRGRWRDNRRQGKPPAPSRSAGGRPSVRPAETSRGAMMFVPASFRFEAVQWLGFRLDLRDTGASSGDVKALLDDLIRPLNDTAAPHGGFEALSSTLTIDLLRYGRMKLGRAWGALTAEDYFSQHELVLRIAVRRAGDVVGDGPAVFVPAIFVDNPWSRYLGREMQGFDKRMLAAYDSDGRLLSDDGQAGGESIPLSGVRHLMARDRQPPPMRRKDQRALLALDYTNDPDRASFIDVADDRLLAPSGLSSFAWRADDAGGDVGDAFDRDPRALRLRGFRSVQFAPVDKRPLPPALIESRVRFDGLQLAFPGGIATLTLDTPRGAPAAWKRLCRFLDAQGGRTVTMPAGDWYRLRCNMSLEVLDPLSW